MNQPKKAGASERVKAPGATKRLAQFLDQKPLAEIEAYESVDSTMLAARAYNKANPGKQALFWAAEQSAGKGRRGNTWSSPVGGSYFTLVLALKTEAQQLPELALATGAALSEELFDRFGIRPSIKWPNDVQIDALKVAGVLVEACDGVAMIGVGVNVNTNLDDLPENATSLLAVFQQPQDVLEITAAFTIRILEWVGKWKKEGFSVVREALRPILACQGEPVRLLLGKETVEGTYEGIDDQGRLALRLDAGLTRYFEAGEVQLLRRQTEAV